MKIGPKFKTAFDKLQQEISIMKQLDHPSIVKLIEVIDDPNSINMFIGILLPFPFNLLIVMEYVQGGQLLEWDENTKSFSSPTYKGFLPEEKLRATFNGIIEGLDYCTFSSF